MNRAAIILAVVVLAALAWWQFTQPGKLSLPPLPEPETTTPAPAPEEAVAPEASTTAPATPDAAPADTTTPEAPAPEAGTPTPEAPATEAPATDTPEATEEGLDEAFADFDAEALIERIAASALDDVQKTSLTGLVNAAANDPALREAARTQIEAALQ